MKYYRGMIVLNNNMNKVNYKRLSIKDCISKSFEITTNNGIISFSGNMPHCVILNTIINRLDYEEEKKQFGYFFENVNFQGFNKDELQMALFLASMGNVIDLMSLEKHEKEEKIVSRMLFFPQDKSLLENQQEYIERIAVENYPFAIAYAQNYIESSEVFASFDAKEELEYLRENCKKQSR